jgi:hypothetical protein
VPQIKLKEVVRMETIKFDSKGRSAPAYSCNKPGDNSGEYVSIDTANAMRSLIIDLQAALRAIDTSSMVKHGAEVRDMIGI